MHRGQQLPWPRATTHFICVTSLTSQEPRCPEGWTPVPGPPVKNQGFSWGNRFGQGCLVESDGPSSAFSYKSYPVRNKYTESAKKRRKKGELETRPSTPRPLPHHPASTNQHECAQLLLAGLHLPPFPQQAPDPKGLECVVTLASASQAQCGQRDQVLERSRPGPTVSATVLESPSLPQGLAAASGDRGPLPARGCAVGVGR